MRKAFTLIELLVVISIVAILTAILLPAIARSRMQAKVLTVNAELRNIALALEGYALDNDSRYPPTRVDCAVGDHFYQLPVELVECNYLPPASDDSFMAAGIEDRFNRGYTYKYRSVGTLIYNRTRVVEKGAYLWVPDGFPHSEQTEGQSYTDPAKAPVSWVLYSQGPNFDLDRMKEMRYPVPSNTWYDPGKRSGVIVRMKLRNGNQEGSFLNRGRK